MQLNCQKVELDQKQDQFFHVFHEMPPKGPLIEKLRLARHRRRITLSSMHIRGRYALRVTLESPRVAIHMICCVSRAKILNYDARDGRRRTLTSIFDIFIIFHILHYF